MKRLLLASSCLLALTVAPAYAQSASGDQVLPQKGAHAPAGAANGASRDEQRPTGGGTAEPNTNRSAADQGTAERTNGQARGQEGEQPARAQAGESGTEQQSGARSGEAEPKRKQAAEPKQGGAAKSAEQARPEEDQSRRQTDAGKAKPATNGSAQRDKEEPAADKAARKSDPAADRTRQADTNENQQRGKANPERRDARTQQDQDQGRTSESKDAQRDRTANQGNDRADRGDSRAEGRVKIDRDRAASLHRDLVDRFGGPGVHLNVRINVGVVVPETVRFRELPSTIVEEYPQFRGYSYFVEDDEVVIVEPRTREVVELIGGDGGPNRAAADEPARAEDMQAGGEHARFSRDQDAVIRRFVTSDRDLVTGGNMHPVLRAPADAELQPLPSSIASEMPGADGFGYFVDRERRVVVVDRDTREVVDIVQ